MSFAIRQPATRPVTILIASMVLAASAAVALTADTHAAKPVPSVFGEGAACRESGSTTTYTAFFNLSANKGKWVNVRVEVKLGSADYETVLAERVETVELNVRTTRNEGAVASTWKLTFMDKKGAVIEAADAVTVHSGSCS